MALEELHDLKEVWSELSKVWEQIDQMKEQPWVSVQPRKVNYSSAVTFPFLRAVFLKVLIRVGVSSSVRVWMLF